MTRETIMQQLCDRIARKDAELHALIEFRDFVRASCVATCQEPAAVLLTLPPERAPESDRATAPAPRTRRGRPPGKPSKSARTQPAAPAAAPEAPTAKPASAQSQRTAIVDAIATIESVEFTLDDVAQLVPGANRKAISDYLGVLKSIGQVVGMGYGKYAKSPVFTSTRSEE